MKYQSILDKNIDELIDMDIEVLKKLFLDEVLALEKMKPVDRNICLEHTFKRLFELYPFHSGKYSLNIFLDLINIPGLKDISYFREGLNNYKSWYGYLDEKKRKVLVKIYEFQDTRSAEEIEKFNYILKSGNEISYEIINEELKNFDLYFSHRVLSLFDKETLSQMYRGFFDEHSYDIQNFFMDNDKGLFLVSAIAKKMKLLTGHNYEFLDNAIRIFNSNLYDTKEMFDDIYDYLVGSRDLEEAFLEYFLNSDSFLEMNELINMINSRDLSPLENNDCFEFYRDFLIDKRNDYHSCVFKDDAIYKIMRGEFDTESDFREINNLGSLENLKKAIFYNLYGISLEEAKELVDVYGSITDLDIDKRDRGIFNILEAIKKILSLDLDDDKIKTLQLMYYKEIVEKGLSSRNRYSSFYVLECLFNKMYLNTYNKNLLKVKGLKLIGRDNGVLVYDSGNYFDIMLTSLDGTYDFYSDNLNMKKKWNSAHNSNTHGLCCTHIRNDSIGVISLRSVLLGFSHIPEYSLNNMGDSDIFSSTHSYNLKKEYEGIRRFITCRNICDENRYGYTEFLIDRFLMNDEDNIYKLQPDYVVFYKFDDDYKESESYRKSLKVAKDFSIPIVVVDIPKLKEHEKKEILELENKLFLSSKCDSSLMMDIVVRYMNNYTGSLILKHDGENVESDFSILGMEQFFDKVISKINSLSDSLKDEWILSLEKVYLEEERKYKKAKRKRHFGCSVKTFVFKRYNLLERIKELKTNVSLSKNKLKLSTIDTYYAEILSRTDLSFENDLDKEVIDFDNSVVRVENYEDSFDVFLRYSDYTDDIKSIVDFVNMLSSDRLGSVFTINSDYKCFGNNGVVIGCSEAEEKEEILIENLIVSYFFESDKMLVDDMICHDFDCDISFRVNDDFNFKKMINRSLVYSDIFDKKSRNYIPLDDKKLDKAIRTIENLSNNDFLRILSPVVGKYAYDNNKRFESVACNLLDKKKNIRKEFERLKDKNKGSLQLKK